MIVELELIKPVKMSIAVDVSDDQVKAIISKAIQMALETLGASLNQK